MALEDDAFWVRVEPPPDEILAADQALERLRRDHPRQFCQRQLAFARRVKAL